MTPSGISSTFLFSPSYKKKSISAQTLFLFSLHKANIFLYRIAMCFVYVYVSVCVRVRVRACDMRERGLQTKKNCRHLHHTLSTSTSTSRFIFRALFLYYSAAPQLSHVLHTYDAFNHSTNNIINLIGLCTTYKPHPTSTG